MKFTTNVQKIGGSLTIIIPAKLKQLLHLKVNSVVEIELNKIEKFDESEHYIICPKCETPIIFKEEEGIVDCPVCGEELHTSDHDIKELE